MEIRYRNWNMDAPGRPAGPAEVRAWAMAGKFFQTANPHTLTDIRLTLLTQIDIFWENAPVQPQQSSKKSVSKSVMLLKFQQAFSRTRQPPRPRLEMAGPAARRSGAAGEKTSARRGVSKISKFGKFSNFLHIFGGLVLGCIKTKFCKKICV